MKGLFSHEPRLLFIVTLFLIFSSVELTIDYKKRLVIGLKLDIFELNG